MADFLPFNNYKIFFTPLVGEITYGAAVDVTADIDLTDFVKSLGTIKREIDNGDYDIGIFTFGDITLNAINFSRKFNDEKDALSIFPFRRDRCKVEIIFYDEQGNSSTRFKGLINDDATRLDIDKDMVRLKVLSLDSIFRQVSVPAGAIVAGDLFSTAIKKILNVPEITSTLTYSASNISVSLDLQIDEGEVFSAIPAKEALDQLLLASNSILFVDNTDTIRVKPRLESANIFYLYGAGDALGRENILSISNYNNGIQRAYNSIAVNENTVFTNTAWVEQYGFRQKSLSFDFITTISKEEQIAENIAAEFRVPKPELEIKVKSSDFQSIDLLDLVQIDLGYRNTPHPDDDGLPMYGSAQYGIDHYAISAGSFKIYPKEKWKVTGIEENPAKNIMTLRLRQAGSSTADGYF
jgi:hypothetical protein